MRGSYEIVGGHAWAKRTCDDNLPNIPGIAAEIVRSQKADMTNLETLRSAYDGTAKGDGRAFVGMLSNEVRWTIIGSTTWSRTFEGKGSVISDLLRPLAAQFDGPNIVTATRYIGHEDVIAVEGHNHSLTKKGE